MRYAIGDERPRSADFFDLGAIDDRLLGWRTFYGGANEHDDSPTHFVALLHGVRPAAQPTIRQAVADLTAYFDDRTGSPD